MHQMRGKERERERERGGEGKPCRLNRAGGGSVDRGALARGGRAHGEKAGWGIRVDQLGSPATRGSLTEKCRESRTVGRAFDPRC